MKFRRLMAGAVTAAAVAGAVLAAQPAGATGLPWLVAGDSNGSISPYCDPGNLSRTTEGASWLNRPAFPTLAFPCSGGGRINALKVAPSGRMFAAGYQYAQNTQKQAILLYSDDAQTWSIAKLGPANGTEYLDVEITNFGWSQNPQLIVWGGTAATSSAHAVQGPYTTGWSGITGDTSSFKDLSTIQAWPSGLSTSLAGQRTGSSGLQCGLIGELDLSPLQVRVYRDYCLPGYDVSFEQSLNTSVDYYALSAVGTATGQGERRPVVLGRRPGTWVPELQLLSGTGSLRAVAANEGAGTTAWVAVGSRGPLGGERGSIFRSTDRGATWTASTLPAGAQPLNEVIWDGSGFVAVGDSGQVLRSVDGDTWTYGQSPIGSTGSLRAIAVR